MLEWVKEGVDATDDLIYIVYCHIVGILCDPRLVALSGRGMLGGLEGMSRLLRWARAVDCELRYKVVGVWVPGEVRSVRRPCCFVGVGLLNL